MKHRAVKCQWKLSSSLFLLLSIFLLLAVFAKEEPLTFLALLVFSEQAVFLLLPMFLTSPKIRKDPFSQEQRHIWTFLKLLQPLICPTLQ